MRKNNNRKHSHLFWLLGYLWSGPLISLDWSPRAPESYNLVPSLDKDCQGHSCSLNYWCLEHRNWSHRVLGPSNPKLWCIMQIYPFGGSGPIDPLLWGFLLGASEAEAEEPFDGIWINPVFPIPPSSTFSPNGAGNCCKEDKAQKRTDFKQALYKCVSF